MMLKMSNQHPGWYVKYRSPRTMIIRSAIKSTIRPGEAFRGESSGGDWSTSSLWSLSLICKEGIVDWAGVCGERFDESGAEATGGMDVRSCCGDKDDVPSTEGRFLLTRVTLS